MFCGDWQATRHIKTVDKAYRQIVKTGEQHFILMGLPYVRLYKLAKTVICINDPTEAALFSVMFDYSAKNNQVISLKQAILNELVAIEDFNFSYLARKILAN